MTDKTTYDNRIVTWEKLREMALNGQISYEEVLNGAEKKYDALKARINELIAERDAAVENLLELRKDFRSLEVLVMSCGEFDGELWYDKNKSRAAKEVIDKIRNSI